MKVPADLTSSRAFELGSDSERALYLWLFVGPLLHPSGLTRLGYSQLADAYRRPLPEILADLLRLQEAEEVFTDGELVYLPRFLPPENPNQLVAVVRYALGLPESALRARWAVKLVTSVPSHWLARVNGDTQRLMSQPTYRAPAPIVAAHVPARPEAPRAIAAVVLPSPAASEPPGPVFRLSSEPAEPAKHEFGNQALGSWNRLTGQTLRGDTGPKLARGRKAEGATLEDLRLVAEWAARGPRAAWFRGANDRRTNYLRPSTLWQASKFWEYLEAAQTWKVHGEDGEDDRRAAEAARFALGREKTMPAKLAAEEAIEPIEEW